MKPIETAAPAEGRWDGRERRLRPRSAGWGRGAATALERLQHLEKMNPAVPDPEPDPSAMREPRQLDRQR